MKVNLNDPSDGLPFLSNPFSYLVVSAFGFVGLTFQKYPMPLSSGWVTPEGVSVNVVLGKTYSGTLNDNVPERSGVVVVSSSFLQDMMHIDAAIANMRMFSLR